MSHIKLNLTEKQASVVMSALYHWATQTSNHAVMLEDKDIPGAESWYADAAMASDTATYICNRLINR